MNLILSGRGVDLSDALRGYASDKLTKAERFSHRIIRIEVDLHQERNPRVKDPSRVEVRVKTPRRTLHVHGEGLDHFAAIDVAADRLEAQLRKRKGRRLLGRGHGGHAEEPAAVPPAAAPAVGSDDEDGEPTIVRMTSPIDKPLTPEEARLELEDRKLLFLLFTDAESMRPAVLFKRDDGDYGLIEHGN